MRVSFLCPLWLGETAEPLPMNRYEMESCHASIIPSTRLAQPQAPGQRFVESVCQQQADRS